MFFNRKKFRYFDLFWLYVKLVPFVAFLRVIQYIISSFIPIINIWVTALFINSAIKIINEGADIKIIATPIIYISAMGLYNYFNNIIFSLINCRADNKMRKIVDPAIAEKRSKIKFRYYENQESMDLISRATGNFFGNISGFFNHVFNLVNYIIMIIGFAATLAVQLWWASILLFVICVPIFYIAYKSGKKMYDADKEMTKIDRKVNYIRDILVSRDTIEERYTYGYVDKQTEVYKKDFEYQRLYRKKINRRRWIDMKATSILVALASIAIIGVLIVPTINGKINFGMFTALAGSILGLGETLSWSLSWIVSDFKYKFEYLKDLNKFMEYEEVEEATVLPSKEKFSLNKIEFIDVCFKYPGTENYILKNLSFIVESGKHYAIVGVNGAGKTTVTKLLTGLYDEYEGIIKVNGRDLKEYKQEEIKSMTAVIYQDFAKYPLDFYNNIAIGNINDMENKTVVEDAVGILSLTETVEKLPEKYATPLTKIKEKGVDLSGGEWQKVALSRLIVNPAPLKILDEPTAALDPISESKVYEEFGSISNHYENSDNTVIFISHRLGSTKLANEIIVMSEGRVAEQGSFDELMKKNGLYAEMFKSQAEWYKNPEENTEESEVKVNG